jgi:hypothetical protein
MKSRKYKVDISLLFNDYSSFVVKKSFVFLIFNFDIYSIFGRCGPRNFPRFPLCLRVILINSALIPSENFVQSFVIFLNSL